MFIVQGHIDASTPPECAARIGAVVEQEALPHAEDCHCVLDPVNAVSADTANLLLERGQMVHKQLQEARAVNVALLDAVRSIHTAVLDQQSPLGKAILSTCESAIAAASSVLLHGVPAPKHADQIANVFTRACVDMLAATRRDDAGARERFSELCDALEAAYPREVRAVLDGVGK
jgi:hypothetical protein